ncbi:nicotinamide riboside transporter PnuC [Streptococcus hongkongensis]|nr:nicotinamide mononucleotide transporter [Streptococcus uberis]
MKTLRYFTPTEWFLWLFSICAIIATAFYFGDQEPLALIASLIGATSLIFSAKGNPIGQGLIIIFSVIYAYLAFHNHYYGELITYCFLTIPMALFSLLSWLSHPFQEQKTQVLINYLKFKDIYLLIVSTIAITCIFYYFLSLFHTPFLAISTLSISTAFAGTFLSYKRSPMFALAYLMNDIILMTLWLMEAQTKVSHYAIVICFAIFLINDIYTVYNWRKIYHSQVIAIKTAENLFNI